MALPYSDDTTDVWTVLATAVKTAWTLTDSQGYIDTPESAPAALPRWGVRLIEDVTYDGQSSTIREGSPVYTFLIEGAFPKPASGSTTAAKMAKYNLLHAQLTASNRLSGYHWYPQ